MTIVFDGAGKGRFIAIAQDGQRFEQTFERCNGCKTIAMILTPLEDGKPIQRRCRCRAHS